MKISELKYDVTPISLEYFKQRSFEIIFEVFNSMNTLDDELIKEYILTIGSDELYESLKYHYDIVYSSILTKNYDLLKDFFIWKYSVYKSRGVDTDCFLKEYELWKEVISNSLYISHSSEINIIYDYLILNHEKFKLNAQETKKIVVNKKYQELFDELLFCLLNGEKSKFYDLVQKNLNLFDNNIFLFIQELINPLMYKVGQLWQLNELSVAKEHLASSLIDEVVNYYIKDNFFEDSNKQKAITSTVGDESHNLGIKIVGKFLESNGFNVKNLGSKISNKELINSIYDLKPNLVVLSVTLSSNVATLQQIVKELKSDYNLFSGKIIVGGQGLFVNNKIIPIKEADFCSKNLEDLKEFLQTLK